MLNPDFKKYPALGKVFNREPPLSITEIKQVLDMLQESAFIPAKLEFYDKYRDNIRVKATRIKDAKAER